MKRIRNQRGAALLEAAITIPLILLVSVGILEFGRAFQTWQVMTNAAREGARVSILADANDTQITTAVRDYMRAGKLEFADTASISINRTKPFGEKTASEITVTYPFNFVALNPVMRLVSKGATTGQGVTNIVATAVMRNEL